MRRLGPSAILPALSRPQSLAPRRLLFTTCLHVLEDGKLLDATGSRHTTRPAHAGVGGHHTTAAHCSLLRTHKPGSPLLLCLARTLMPLRRFLNPSFDCSLLEYPPFPKSTDPFSIPRSQIPGPRNVSSDKQDAFALQALFEAAAPYMPETVASDTDASGTDHSLIDSQDSDASDD